MIWRFFSSAILVSIVLLTGIALPSCNQDQPLKSTIITGQLPDMATAEIKTSLNDHEFLVIADSAGHFRMELDLSRDHYLWFDGLDRHLYLIPGDSIFIVKDGSGAHPYLFSKGESGLINTWYAEKDSKLRILLDTVDIKKYYSQDASSYKSLNTRVISDFHDLLDQFCREHPGISESFRMLEKENIRHYWYYELNVYHHENYAYTGIKPELPEHFYDYLETVRLNDTRLFQYMGYRYFLYSWVNLQIHLQGKDLKGPQKTHQILDLVEATFTVPEIQEDVGWECLRLQNSRMQVDEDVLSRASDLGIDGERLDKAREYMKTLQSLSAGNPAPDFELLDVKNHMSSLSDFAGKYLLIDIWSTSCSPCFREIPRLEDIKYDLQGENIEIIAVCLSNEELWKKKLKELGLDNKGQYRVDKGWSSEFSNNYLRGSGVPVYIIIDPEGKIVTARAPYPSQGLRAQLEELAI